VKAVVLASGEESLLPLTAPLAEEEIQKLHLN
jgi:hypothetical protein